MVCSSAVFLTSTVTIGIGVRGGILDDINHLPYHARVYKLHQQHFDAIAVASVATCCGSLQLHLTEER